MRVGVDTTVSSVSTGSSSVTFTDRVYTQNQYNYNDSQTLTFSGSRGSGSINFQNSQGSGTITLRGTRTWTYTYPSGSYGSSPGQSTFTATLSGAYNGVTPSRTNTNTIPARPYAAPLAQTSVSTVRNSDSQATTTWNRNNTAQRPYTSQNVEIRSYNNGWSSWGGAGTLSSTATSFVRTGLASNRAYQFRVRANNSVGSSGWVSGTIIYTTGAPPSNVSAEVDPSGNAINVTWTPEQAYGGGSFEIERSVNGGAYVSVATGIAPTVTQWIDPSPGAGTNQYRIRYVSPNNLNSTWVQSNVVSTIVPPLAPTQLSPDGGVVDFNDDVVFSWRHNHGGDGASQSAYEIEYRESGDTSWTPLTSGSSPQLYTLPGGTLANSTSWEWRVRTQGVSSEGFGPWSAIAEIRGAARPVVTIILPDPTTQTLPLVAAWNYAQDDGQPQTQWEAVLLDASGTQTLQTLSGSSAAGSALFTYPVTDTTTYTVRVRARSADGLWSDWQSVQTVIDLIPPATPHVDAFYDACTGSVALDIWADDPVPVPVVLRTNLMDNGSFELASGEWPQGSYTHPARSAERSVVGDYSLKFVHEGRPGQGMGTRTITELLPGAGTYRIGLWAYTPAANTRAAAGLRVDGTGTPALNLTTSERDQWVWIENAFSYDGVGTVTLGGWVTGSGMQSPTDTVYVDGLIIEQDTGVPLAGYFDGDTPPSGNREYRWTGTPGASASEEVIPASDNVAYVDVQRRIDGGEWRTIATNVYVNNQLPQVYSEGFEGGNADWIANSEFGSYGPDPDVVSTDAAGPPLPLPEGTHYLDITWKTDNPSLYGQNVVGPVSGLTVGETYTAVMSVYNPTDVGLAAKASFITPPEGSVPIGADPDWQTVAITWVATAETNHIGVVATSPINGEKTAIDNVVVYVGTTTDYNGMIQEPTTIVDPIPQTVGMNEYRVIAYAQSGSTSTSEIAEAEGTNDTSDSCWAFLAYGPTFSNVVRAGGGLLISTTTSRARAAAALLRAGLPLGLVGPQTGRIVDVTASLYFQTRNSCEDDPCAYDSSRDDWEKASWDSSVVCYRDYTGRRIFGVLGPDLVTSDGPILGTAELGFSVVQTDYDEPTWTV